MNMDSLIKIASNDDYIVQALQHLNLQAKPEDQMTFLKDFGNTLETNNTHPFHPYIYIANYIETKSQFWDIIAKKLHEEFVTFVFITWGFNNGLQRNPNNFTLEYAKKLINPPLAVYFEGCVKLSFFDQYIVTKSQVDVVLNKLESERHIEYYYSDDTFNKIWNSLCPSKDIQHIDNKDILYKKFDQVLCIYHKTKFVKSIDDYLREVNDVLCKGFLIKNAGAQNTTYISEDVSKTLFVSD